MVIRQSLGSLFSKESGRMRHTLKVSIIRVDMMISCLALVIHKIYITPADLTLPDKTILLLSGWHISPILSAARTSQHSHFGVRITSPRTASARWLNGEDNLPLLDGVRDFDTLLNFFRFSHLHTHSLCIIQGDHREPSKKSCVQKAHGFVRW